MSSILPSKELLRERYKSSHTIFVIAAAVSYSGYYHKTSGLPHCYGLTN